jgi:asparagine synthase (glutamine-hydrolysing)
MPWFGGFIGTAAPTVQPEGARYLTSGPATLWTADDWPAERTLTVTHAGQTLAVFGPCSATAAELARLFARGAPGSPTTWSGSYTVVHASQQGVTIVTDLGHACPIYLARSALGVYWASSSRALAALTSAAVDRGWLSAWLRGEQLDADESGLRPSAFAGVTAAPAGARLTIGPTGRVVVAPVTTNRELTFTQAAAELAEALTAAVTLRVQKAARPASDCSGGLDSTSLCLLAARAVAPDREMLAITVHPAGVSAGGDLDYARTAADSMRNIDHQRLPLGPRHAPYSRLLDLPPTDEPPPSAVTYARLAAELNLLAHVGSDCLLTGDGGDALLVGTPALLADAIMSRRIGAVWTGAIDWARLLKCSPWPLLREATRQSRRAGDCSVMTQVIRDSIQAVGRSARADSQLAAHHGIELHNPFTDSRVIEVVLALNPLAHLSPRSYKPLLKVAMRDVLPARVAGRTTKGGCDADHFLGVRAHRASLLGLADGRLAELRLVGPARLRQTINDTADGIVASLAELEPTIAAEAWLRALDRQPAATWVAAPRSPASATR